MKAMLLLLFAMLLGGCAHSTSASNLAISDVAYRIIERAYRDGWETSGEITVSTSGKYTWAVTNIWQLGNLWQGASRSQTFTGLCPDSIMTQLIASRTAFEFHNGIRYYEVCIDDTKSRHPAGVDALLSYLRGVHFASSL
jgi:hypothetical protein